MTVVGFVVDIVVLISITVLQDCPLIFREISPCELKGKTGNRAVIPLQRRISFVNHP